MIIISLLQHIMCLHEGHITWSYVNVMLQCKYFITGRLKWRLMAAKRSELLKISITAYSSKCMCLYANMLIFICIKKYILYRLWLVLCSMLKLQSGSDMVLQASVLILKYLRIAVGFIQQFMWRKGSEIMDI